MITRWSLVAAAAIAATGCMEQGLRPSRDADLAAITAFNQRYLQAINDGDFATLSGLTVDDHVMIAAGRPPLAGKAANDQANQRAFEQFRFAEQWTPLNTVIEGGLACQAGTFTTSATPRQARPGDETRSVAGSFMRIYRRLPDQSWTMVVDTFNSAPQEPGPARDADRAAITAFNQRYLQAINDGDFVTLSALTVDDHVMMAPNRAPIAGKAANDEANRRAFEQFRVAEQWTPVNTVFAAGLACQTGTFTTAASPRQGGDTRSVAGRFMRIYRRLPDQSWTMVIDLFNSGPQEAH